MLGPFGFARGTFAAFVVIGASVLVSVLWAVIALRSDRRGGGVDDE